MLARGLALPYPLPVNTQLRTTGVALILLSALSTVVACKSTQTDITQSYRNPGFEETVFKKLFVIGVAQDHESRQAFEDSFTSAIAEQGGTAHASWSVLPKAEQLSEEEIRAAIESGGFDGVLISRLLSVDHENTEYTAPSTYNNPRTRYYSGGGWGRGFYGFYGTTFAQVHEPGYFETSTTLRLETNLYSVATDGLVWTGQSKTIDPDSVDDARSSMTAAVAQKLKEERLIP